MGNPMEDAAAAASTLASLTGIARHDVAIVLGSGWVPAIDVMATEFVDLANTDLPGFLPPAVEGHAGRIRSFDLGGKRVLAFLGRTHYYEGRGVRAVAHAVRTAAAAGCSLVVLTNGCGGIRDDLDVGDAVLISDHLNLTAASSLEGAQFVDLTDLYSSRLRSLMLDIDPTLKQGVYVQLTGPHYETPAEIRMLRTLGGDLVGMSTALEAIAARAAGAEVLGISLVTNKAAGITGEPLNHEEVLATGKASATRIGGLLAELIGRL